MSAAAQFGGGSSTNLSVASAAAAAANNNKNKANKKEKRKKEAERKDTEVDWPMTQARAFELWSHVVFLKRIDRKALTPN